MEEKLIEAVFRFPEIYNPAMKEHKDMKRRAAAWRCVGIQVGISEEEGKRTWWNFCYKYRNERLAGKLRRSGYTPRTQRPWKFMQLLHFQEQPSTSHMNLDRPAADTLSTAECDTPFCSTSRHPADSLQCPTPAAVPFNFPSTPESSRSPSPAAHRPLHLLLGNITGSTSPTTLSRPKRSRTELTEFEAQLLSILSVPLDEDDLYALSLAAIMRKLRCQIEECLYEVMFGEEH